MRRIMLTTLTVLAVASPLAVPAIASANATTNLVARQFATQIRNRASLSGVTITSTSVKCKSDGRGYYSCWATYTALVGRKHVQYGAYLNVTPGRWYVVGTPRLIRVY
jgi:hypothetical protein